MYVGSILNKYENIKITVVTLISKVMKYNLNRTYIKFVILTLLSQIVNIVLILEISLDTPRFIHVSFGHYVILFIYNVY